MSAFGPHNILYVGMRLALADSPHGYLILAQGQEDPVRVFERSSGGWQQAYQAFVQWEPNAQAVGSPYGQPSARPGPLVPTPGPVPYAYGPGPYVQPYGPPVQGRSPSGVGVAGGITGIVGAVLSLIPLLGIVLGLLLGPIAIILSSIGLAQSGAGSPGGPRPKGLAVTGLVLGILTVVFKLIPGVDLA